MYMVCLCVVVGFVANHVYFIVFLLECLFFLRSMRVDVIAYKKDLSRVKMHCIDLDDVPVMYKLYIE